MMARVLLVMAAVLFVILFATSFAVIVWSVRP